MTIQITLPDNTLAALLSQAQAQGRPAEELAADALSALFAPAAPEEIDPDTEAPNPLKNGFDDLDNGRTIALADAQKRAAQRLPSPLPPDTPHPAMSEPAPIPYAVRFSAQAQQDITNAAFRLADLTEDPAAALAWADGLYQEAARLGLFPHAFPLAAQETRQFNRQTRQLLYKRTASAAPYRLLFAVADTGDDGPTVTIIHVRHSGRRAPTREEARQILANQ